MVSLNLEGKKDKWTPDLQNQTDGNRRTTEVRKAASDKVKPVKIKIKRLEKLAGNSRDRRGKSPATQTKILKYLTKVPMAGGDSGTKVLRTTPRQNNSLLKGRCPDNRALLWAQREASEPK